MKVAYWIKALSFKILLILQKILNDKITVIKSITILKRQGALRYFWKLQNKKPRMNPKEFKRADENL